MDIKSKLLKSKEEFLSRYFWKCLRCEFIGTLLYIVFGCGSTVVWNKELRDYRAFRNVEVSLSFGLTELLLIKSLGHTSGGHFNPALTISMLCARHISVIRALCYIIIQFVAAIIGEGILYGMVPSKLHGNLGVTLLINDIDKGQAFGVEFMATFIFVYVYFSTLQQNNDTLVPEAMYCGTAVCLSTLFSINATGASINPARSFGPALIMNIWKDHWVYWVGPILGGILGGFTFEYTKDSSNHFENFRRSLRQRVYSLRGKDDCASTNSIATELTCEHDVATEEVQMC